MAVTYTYEVLDRPVPASGALRREPLLDPSVCGVWEVEQVVVAVRITLLDAAGAPHAVLDGAFYPTTRELGVTHGAEAPIWVSARSVEDGIDRWLAAREAARTR